MLSSTLFILLVIFLFQQLSFAQNKDKNNENEQVDEDVVRVDTSLVTIPATVLDREGRYITNLKKEDFQIFENGIKQDVEFFEQVDQPFTVFLLLDTSGSMRDYLPDLTSAANVFVDKLRPDDQLVAAEFSDQVHQLFKATRIKDLRKGISLTQRAREGDTIVYDAVDFALKKTNKIRGRKAIILFSDGVGTGIATAKGTLKDAEEQEAIIYTVQFGSFPAEPPNYVSGKQYFKRIEEINGYMRDLAQKTGGRQYHIEDISNLEQTFGMIVDELSRQYSIGYYPKLSGKVGERKQIKVKVNLPNVAVRSRDSYVVGNSKK